MEEVPATSPESGAPEMRHVEPGRLEQEQMAAVGGYSPPPETWRMFMSQLGQLLQSAAQLIATMSEGHIALGCRNTLGDFSRTSSTSASTSAASSRPQNFPE
ncbi:uncharacterized protein LOC144718006 [Lampetra planeri]